MRQCFDCSFYDSGVCRKTRNFISVGDFDWCGEYQPPDASCGSCKYFFRIIDSETGEKTNRGFCCVDPPSAGGYWNNLPMVHGRIFSQMEVDEDRICSRWEFE